MAGLWVEGGKKMGWWDIGHGKTVLNSNMNVCLSPPFGKTFCSVPAFVLSVN